MCPLNGDCAMPDTYSRSISCLLRRFPSSSDNYPKEEGRRLLEQVEKGKGRAGLHRLHYFVEAESPQTNIHTHCLRYSSLLLIVKLGYSAIVWQGTVLDLGPSLQATELQTLNE